VTETHSNATWAALKKLRRERNPSERCELCALELPSRHPHLFHAQARRIACACDGCALLFETDGSQMYKRIPRDVLYLPDFAIEDLEWEFLSIPISLAFFFLNSASQRTTAMYPSPGGATESLLHLDSWLAIASRYSRVQKLLPDVEALLVNRVSTPHAYFIAPIDRCYELAGIVRKQWRGFSGSEEVWKNISDFFSRLREEAHTINA
jgi:Family of unknown function (DUF5947)